MLVVQERKLRLALARHSMAIRRIVPGIFPMELIRLDPILTSQCQSVRMIQIPGGFMTCTGTCGNGVWIGL